MANSNPDNSDPLKDGIDDSVLLESIVDEFTQRLRSGEHPSIAEYQEKHPSLKSELEDLLASVAMIEQLKPSASEPANQRPSLDEVSKLDQIGSYTVVGEVGRGGMGIVFEAVHESLGRRVAIKVMPTPLVNSAQHVERFEREAKAAAKLHHTNIVSVFGFGEGDGFHYYVMDLVDGRTLGEVVVGLTDSFSISQPVATERGDETRVENLRATLPPGSAEKDDLSDGFFLSSADSSDAESGRRHNDAQLDGRFQPPERKVSSRHFRWAARIGANIADALSYAHQANILHRDIKPSNIILDRKGVVWITDFGLAKDSSNDINLTKTGDVIGTPQYLAPESLEGKYDQRSEVYCLGLTLYELATLQPAYQIGTTAEVIRAIATTPPTSPRKINPKIPIDLSTIIDKAVARDPDSRYQTAAEVRADLLAFVEDRPINARPPSTMENVIKWSRRNPLAAVLSAVSALLLTLVAVSATIGYLYTIDALDKEATKSAQLEAEKGESERQRNAALDARNQAELFAQKMKVQYDRAEANVDVTLEAFDEMFKQVMSRGATSQASSDVVGFEELMGIETTVTRQDAEFLEKLLVFYDRFANQNAENESLMLESARAFRRAANIHQLVGQYKQSIEPYRKSIAIYERILNDSDSKEVLMSLVQVKSELARGLRLENSRESWPVALKENEEAIELLESVPLNQLDDELKFELAKTLNSLGSSNALIAVLNPQRADLRDMHRPLQWLDIYREVVNEKRNGDLSSGKAQERGKRGKGQVGRPRLGGRPNDGQGQNKPGKFAERGQKGQKRGSGGDRGVRRGSNGVGGVGRKLNELSQKSLELVEELIEANPENIEYRSARANAYCSLAASQLVPNPAQASELRKKAIEEIEFLIEQNEENPAYRFRLALACMLGDFSDPSQDELDLLDRSIKLTEMLTTQFPQVPDYHSLYGSIRCKESQVLLENDEFEAALKALVNAKTSFDHVVELQPDDRALKSRMYIALTSHLRTLFDQAKEAGKMKIVQAAKSLVEQSRQRGSGRGKSQR